MPSLFSPENFSPSNTPTPCGLLGSHCPRWVLGAQVVAELLNGESLEVPLL